MAASSSVSDPAGEAIAAGGADAPDVSFVVCAFDVAPFVEAAVRSALAQRDVTVEVIVVDDASRDGTGDVVARMAKVDERIRLIRRTDNGGPSAARNHALAVARGRWIAQLDGDDTIDPERVRRLVDLADAVDADMVADNFERIAEDGRPLGSTMIPLSAHPYAFHLDLAGFVGGNIFFERPRFSYAAIKPLVRADFVRRHALRYFDDPAIRHEDFLFVVEALLAGAQFVVSSETLYRYRQRASSISFRITAAQVAAMQRANAALELRQRVAADAKAAAAFARYEAALSRAGRFIGAVEALKQRDIRAALREGGLGPQLLPLAARFGAEAVARRFVSLAHGARRSGGPA